MTLDEWFDLPCGAHEVCRELGVGRLADQHEHAHTVSHHPFQLIGRVANPPIVRQDVPPAAADFLEPLRIWLVVGEVVGMAFDGQSGVTEELG